MKKIISMLLVFASLFVLTGCRILKVSTAGDYRYADYWQQDAMIKDSKATPVNPQDDPDWQEVLDYCKELVKLSITHNENFAWDALETVQCKTADGMRLAWNKVDTDVKAFYREEDNTVYIVSMADNEDEPNYVIGVLVHELAHCLTCQNGATDRISEGAAEFIALSVMQVCEIEYQIAYFDDVILFTWLHDAFGYSVIWQHVCDNTIYDLIDETLDKPGMGKKFDQALVTMYAARTGHRSETEFDYASHAALDILCHITGKLGQPDTDDDIIELTFSQLRIEKDEYFTAVLNGETPA